MLKLAKKYKIYYFLFGGKYKIYYFYKVFKAIQKTSKLNLKILIS